MALTAVVEQTLDSSGLIYSSDSQPGIIRKKAGKGFTYVNPDGSKVSDPKVLNRIKSLVLPPAYKSVWICKSARGYIQATGLDAKGRKQYRYHEQWSAARGIEKFEHMAEFGAALPQIRERLDKDLRKAGLPREKVLAVIVKLLEETLIRVGNVQYARDNDSYGLTTLKNKHLKVEGSRIRFKFKGKSGVEHAVSISDRRLSPVLKKLQHLPGQELFTYQDNEKNPHSITSSDVNNYLKEISGKDFTAKDFRTWAATLLAFSEFAQCEDCGSETARKKTIAAVVKKVAARLGNTPAVCRKSYIHSELLANAEKALPIKIRSNGDWSDGLLKFLKSLKKTGGSV